MTAAGRRRLAELGVTLVLDLRESTEQQAEPTTTGTAEVLHVPLYWTASVSPLSGTLDEAYSTLVRDRGTSIARAVGAIADADGAVLVHCAVGKDRTGLVVALALLSGGTPRKEVVADYAPSGALVEAARPPAVEALLRDSGVVGAAAVDALRLHLESPVEAMSHALALIDDLGGPHASLLHHGMSPQHLARIRDRASTAHGADLIGYAA